VDVRLVEFESLNKGVRLSNDHPLRIRRTIQKLAVLDAHHRLDLEVGFFVAGEADVRKDQDCL
jgi:hypothetical protein